MTHDSIRQELDDLRVQLEEMRAARESEARADESSAGDPSDASSDGPADTAQSEIAKQFLQLVEGLDRELKETRPTTLLAVFALGVLVGRLSSR